VQGLLVHLFELSLYGLELPSDEHQNGDIEQAEILLDMIISRSREPLSVARPPDQRIGVICREYALLACCALRERHIPARTRGGYANYLAPGRWIGHSVCEVWDSQGRRWVRFDPQIDAVQKKAHDIEFNVLDLPQTSWLSGAEAWCSYRKGELAATTVEGGVADLRNGVVLDLLEMCKLETHHYRPPIMLQPSNPPTPEETSCIDAIAGATLSSQETFSGIWSLYKSEPRVQITLDD
jgi:hypothetical protein